MTAYPAPVGAPPAPPWHAEYPSLMRWREVLMGEARPIPAPFLAARAVVQEFNNLTTYEEKAQRVLAHPEGPTGGYYEVWGSFAGVPWRGRFRYWLNDAGFHSVKEGDFPPHVGVSGGFIVAPIDADHSLVYHYEDYLLPWWAIPLRPLVRAYLAWSMRKELRTIERLAMTQA